MVLTKTTLGQSGFLCPKSQHFRPFGEKCLLDNTTGARYLNSSCLLPDDDCRFFRFHYILGCIRLPLTTLNFPLFRSRKGNSYH